VKGLWPLTSIQGNAEPMHKHAPSPPLDEDLGGEQAIQDRSDFVRVSEVSRLEAQAAPDAQQETVPATKNCPFCGETILDIAVKCKHCGEFLAGDSRANIALPVPNSPSSDVEDKSSSSALIAWLLLCLSFGFFFGALFWNGRLDKADALEERVIDAQRGLRIAMGRISGDYGQPEAKPVKADRTGVYVLWVISALFAGLGLLCFALGRNPTRQDHAPSATPQPVPRPSRTNGGA
jgi:hypothetical protein